MKDFTMELESATGKTTLDQYLSEFDGEPIYYGNASHGFYDIMVWLQKNRPKDKPNIVMPVYIPAKLYRFILAAGYEPKFYDVPTDLNIDLGEITDLIDDQTQAVFAVHFFGIPVDLQPLKKCTERAGVFLIEDCAHSLNASYKGRELGSTGDFTLFSTRKMLQLHCGGVLVLNTKPWDFEPSQDERVWSPFTFYHFAGSRFKHTVNHYLKAASPFKLTEIPYDGYIDFSDEHFVRVKRMDLFFRWYNNIPDLNQVARTRRENFLYLLNGIDDQVSFCPIGSERYSKRDQTNKYVLHNGFVPFSMPILTPPGTRKLVQKALCNAGVLCFVGWPEAPFGLDGFVGATVLKERMLELPVHQFMDKYHLKVMVDCLNSLSNIH